MGHYSDMYDTLTKEDLEVELTKLELELNNINVMKIDLTSLLDYAKTSFVQNFIEDSIKNLDYKIMGVQRKIDQLTVAIVNDYELCRLDLARL